MSSAERRGGHIGWIQPMCPAENNPAEFKPPSFVPDHWEQITIYLVGTPHNSDTVFDYKGFTHTIEHWEWSGVGAVEIRTRYSKGKNQEERSHLYMHLGESPPEDPCPLEPKL